MDTKMNKHTLVLAVVASPLWSRRREREGMVGGFGEMREEVRGVEKCEGAGRFIERANMDSTMLFAHGVG